MANYVLVHGAWGGNQSYELTVRDLEAAGHRVLNCTLPGLGTRQAELHPGITLSDHIDAVCEQVAASGFKRFVLAGNVPQAFAVAREEGVDVADRVDLPSEAAGDAGDDHPAVGVTGEDEALESRGGDLLAHGVDVIG